VVGYVDADRHGQAGVEYSHKKFLERSVQTLQLSRTGNGALMSDYVPKGFVHVDDLRLQLTLDIRPAQPPATALSTSASSMLSGGA